MSSYETIATVEKAGTVHVSGVPFDAGTEVEVLISPRRRPADEFSAAWKRLCEALRRRPQIRTMSEEEIEAEIIRQRAGA